MSPLPRHVPRKRFGQHFLIDAGVVRAIVDAIAPRADDTLVEIGPGTGALTRPLLARVARLHVVEIDRDLAARWRDDAASASGALQVHMADALAFDFGALGPRVRVVGNLPYNISTPLLFHLAGVDALVDGHFMLQREVVERMVAPAGASAYGRLSVMLQARFAMVALFDVPRDAFDPPPKVTSSVVRMVPLAQRPVPATDAVAFEAIVAAAFGQRRKTLRNTLRDWLTPADFDAARIDPASRAEQIDVAAFARAARLVAARRAQAA
ncbi:MAG: 16S rRNA (adenine(1518)-N(6)/adenine(1519)-N(6))-dimethyltransferase RsmA [Burkholderiales bacterium]|jgi:16S rRNA (adenine1518-N6/adenine1519-N6)-dimethyltransferase|nr:16S rRNA (adenine(1518)-N(6)/adenine(1519)-N(6))-dimethyltransferase RsmA [Burkholderiales bacterium]